MKIHFMMEGFCTNDEPMISPSLYRNIDAISIVFEGVYAKLEPPPNYQNTPRV
jgi:hypothetical protein